MGEGRPEGGGKGGRETKRVREKYSVVKTGSGGAWGERAWNESLTLGETRKGV